MFEGEAHRSYVQLCRELRLEREWQNGDVFLWPHGRAGFYCTDDESEYVPGKYRQTRANAVWLPRLDQWLLMLEEAGVLGVDIERLGAVWFATSHEPGTDREGYARRGATREEAAARLWMAVTGRTVTSG